MNADVVLGVIHEILKNNNDKIYQIAQTCGGWEIWLQCELAYCFGAEDIAVQREVCVWGDRRACDLYFHDNKYIVELKCLGWNVIQTSKRSSGSYQATEAALETFAERVLDDRKKIEEYKGSGSSIAIIPDFINGDAEKICKFLTSKGYYVDDSIKGFYFACFDQK